MPYFTSWDQICISVCLLIHDRLVNGYEDHRCIHRDHSFLDLRALIIVIVSVDA